MFTASVSNCELSRLGLDKSKVKLPISSLEELDYLLTVYIPYFKQLLKVEAN